MRKPLNIYAAGGFAAVAGGEPTPLKARVKQACGESKRRIDRVTQLALLGVCDCTAGLTPPEHTGLYMSSVYGSLNNSREILYDMFYHGEAPSPFKFINTVGSTACYYLSQHFGFQGNTISLAQADFPLQNGIELAGLDLATRRVDAALVGVTSEVGYPLEVHRQRVGVTDDRPIAEGSYWLLIGEDIPGLTPVARIVDNRAFADERELMEWISSQRADTPLQTAFDSKVDEPMQQQILKRLQNVTSTASETEDVFYEFPAAVTIHDFIRNGNPEADTLLHIDTAADGRRHAIVIEKTNYRHSQ